MLGGLALLAAFVLGIIAPPPALSQDRPPWWDQAQKSAKQDGYRIIGDQELWAALNQPGRMLLVDVRPDYEFKRGHIPGAVNLEFHLGHRSQLTPEMIKAFRALAGSDRDRRIIIYCRSFR